MAKARRTRVKKVVSNDNSDRHKSAYQMRADEVERDLIAGRNTKALQEYFGEATYEELRGLAHESRRAPLTGDRVYILPGIMGSQLGSANDVIWIDPFDVRRGRLVELSLRPKRPSIRSVGVIPLAYFMLKFRLRRAGFDAEFFDYDWRQSIDRLGESLAQKLKQEASDQISIVGHSMGGLVARAAMAAAGDKINRLIMLGTPNHGSFMPIQAFHGTYSILQRVAALDKKHSAEQLAREAVVTWDGLCQMLPTPGKFSAVDLYQRNNWPSKFPSPPQELLENARKVQKSLADGNSNCFLIAGVNRYTVTSIKSDGDEFIERLSLAGDGTVPLELAQLDNVKTYFVEEDHGSLQNNRQVTAAIIELLDRGETDELPQEWSAPRNLPTRERKESEFLAESQSTVPIDDMSIAEIRGILREVAAPPKSDELPVTVAAPMEGLTSSLKNVIVGRRMQHRIQLRLSQGSIAAVNSRAVVLGIFKDVAPSGPALALDNLLGNAITEFTQRRMFSANVGEVFIMPTRQRGIGTEMILFAGLGAFDGLNDSVQQVVAENTIRTFIRTGVEEFATVIFGAGSGADIGRSLENLLKGFIRGLLDTDSNHNFRGITLCEFDEQRYRVIRQELYRLASTSLFDSVEVVFDELPLPEIIVPRAALPAEPRQQDPDPLYLIVRRETSPARLFDKRSGRVIVREGEDGNGHIRDASENLFFRVSLLTAGGKATVISDLKEVNATALEKHLELLESDSFSFAKLPAFGRRLAELVFPSTILDAFSDKQMKKDPKRHLVIVNDGPASRIPWETIHIDGWVPATGSGLSRRYMADNLSIAKWREERKSGSKLSVLLVVNPTEDLHGADEEGDRIGDLLKRNAAVEVTEIRHGQATVKRLMSEFNSGKYDVVHYAGHAFFDPRQRSRSGIICAGERVLSGSQLAGLSRLPFLVFFNACEAGRVRGRTSTKDAELSICERIDRNVSLAEAYLRGGIANYVGTYWPVGDASAKNFATTFYSQLLRGVPVGKALVAGRDEVMNLKSVDWADYIHYGDHEFRLKNA